MRKIEGYIGLNFKKTKMCRPIYSVRLALCFVVRLHTNVRKYLATHAFYIRNVEFLLYAKIYFNILNDRWLCGLAVPKPPLYDPLSILGIRGFFIKIYRPIVADCAMFT